MKKNNVIPELFATAGDSPGEINLQWDSFQGATAYAIQAGKKDSKIRWKLLDIAFEPKYAVNGLKPRTEYCFRIAVLDSKRQNSWSAPVIKRSP